jgi:hypothetical protein
MAEEEEPLLSNPGTPEAARHVEDYSLFTSILKWGAIASLAVAFIVLLLIG